MMNKNNVFYKLRLFIFIAAIFLGWLVYANYTGWRVFSFGSNSAWSSSGPGYHK